MFTPTKQFRKLLGSGLCDCAYAYQDGIALIETRPVKIDKDRNTYIEVAHLYPCEIPIRAHDYDQSESWKYTSWEVDRVVFHSPILLWYGVREIEIASGHLTDHLTAKGMTAIHTTVYTVDGVPITETWVHDLIVSRVTVQPDPHYALGVQKRRELASIHDHECKDNFITYAAG